VGLDVHKHYIMVGAVNAAQETVLPPRKVSLLEFEGWAKKYLRPTDEVVPSTGPLRQAQDAASSGSGCTQDRPGSDHQRLVCL
jgi:hypothetical protein